MHPREILEVAVATVRAWIARWFEVQGVDRAMALAAQAFSALIPLLIIYTAIVPTPDSHDFAESLIATFDLTGTSADSVRQAFSSRESVEDSISLLSFLITIISALSFSRGMQRLYEGAYRLPSRGMRNTRWGLAWLGLIALYFTLRPALAGLFDGPLLHTVVSLVLGAVAWTVTPSLLLGRRLPWKKLLPGAALSTLGMTALTISSIIWLPRTIASSAEQFGVMGVAFALLSWLVAASFILVAAATGGAVLMDGPRHRIDRAPHV